MIGTRHFWSAGDERYMRRALELARLGYGRTSPNPAVGAVLVKNGQVLAEGYHRAYGQPHAEIEALDQLPDRSMAEGATFYITLEPCCHWGKTPPCTDALLAAKVGRVVIAHLDSYAEVSGRGAQILRDAGLRVEVGLLEREATRLNAGFLMRQRHRRPFISAKWAMTLDGRISATSGDSKWISSAASRRRVHEVRAETDAILVGIGTVLKDNPRLNARLPDRPDAPQPRRVIIDAHLKTPYKAKLFEAKPAGPVILVTSELAKEDLVKRFKDRDDVELIQLPHEHGMLDLKLAAEELAKRGIQTLLVEGGGQINGSFLRLGLIDQVIAFVSPKLIGGGASSAPIEGFEGGPMMSDALRLACVDVKAFGSDLCLTGYVVKPDALEGLYAEGEDQSVSSMAWGEA